MFGYEWNITYFYKMKHIFYIYKVTNKLNNKSYIGRHSSNNLNNSYLGSGTSIKKAIKQFGKDNFFKEVIYIAKNQKELDEKEIYYINYYKTYENGYNITKGGKGMLGYKPSKETILKSSKSRKKYYEENPDAIKKLSELGKLKKGSLNPFYGKKLSLEHIDKMTKARVKAITGAKNPSAVKLLCVEKNIIFHTAKEAAFFCGLKHSTSILKSAKGKNGLKTAGGYTWEIIN